MSQIAYLKSIPTFYERGHLEVNPPLNVENGANLCDFKPTDV